MSKRRKYPTNSLVAKVGIRIRALRNKQGVALRPFGKLAGLHPFHVMAIELGELAANTKTLRAIANALGVAPLDLLNCGNDDDGAIVELMRIRPECIRLASARLKQ